MSKLSLDTCTRDIGFYAENCMFFFYGKLFLQYNELESVKYKYKEIKIHKFRCMKLN